MTGMFFIKGYAQRTEVLTLGVFHFDFPNLDMQQISEEDQINVLSPVYQKEIEKEFGLRPSTATEVLKNLEKDGLICRVPEEQDGRYKRIIFTEKAEAIRETLKDEIEGSEKLLLEGISEGEKQEFLRIAQRMLDNLDRQN